MISVIITSFKEPDTIGRAIENFLDQTYKGEYELIVAAPDEETSKVIKQYAKKDSRVKYFADPGKGKSFALNLLLKKVKGDLLILSDGDVYVSSNVLEEFMRLFEDPKIGCATGKPISSNSRLNMMGYWSHLLFHGAHRIRRELFDKGEFLECSGYLFGFRNGVISEFPLDVAEDTVIPYYFLEKGYKIGYVPKAEVYVKNPEHFRDWIKQKVRTAKAHETLEKYVDVNKTKRVKSFSNEAKKGLKWAFSYPSNTKEVIWTLMLIPARTYMWGRVFLDTRLKNKHYGDAWERVESTK